MTPRAAVYTIYPVRVLAPDGSVIFPVCARTWPDALTIVQVLLLRDGIRTSRRGK